MPNGFYVLTKRFSSKEERRRVVAFVIDPSELPAPFYGFENHLNVFHIAKHGMDRETARGLALFLNSTVVDSHFRIFSGHTQVNATDLRQMRYPGHAQLLELGRLVTAETHDQAAIDRLIKEVETRWQSTYSKGARLELFFHHQNISTLAPNALSARSPALGHS